MFIGSRDDLTREIERCDRMIAEKRANLARVDDYEQHGDKMDYEAARKSFRASAEHLEIWSARLRRFAEVW
jgi:membrane-bound lytic murein transglycosylase MltF